MMKRLTTHSFWTLGALLALASPAAAQCDACVFPGKSWGVLYGAELAREGWDADTLQGLSAFLREERQSTSNHLVTARFDVYMLYSNWDFSAAGAIFQQLKVRDICDEARTQVLVLSDRGSLYCPRSTS